MAVWDGRVLVTAPLATPLQERRLLRRVTLSQWIPVRVTRWWLERKAGQISDPIARLRYLREREAILSRRVEPIPPRLIWSSVLILLAAATAGTRVWQNPPAEPPARVQAKVTHPASKPQATAPEEKIWLVETRNGVETWSNGLRIETRFTTANQPRIYARYDRARNLERVPQTETKIIGIVYHTTESQLTAFDPAQNRRMLYFGEGLLGYVQRERFYNYVIDRFGRAFRVVREEDRAFHAGPSIWADADYAYLDLNDSFLGVSFETQSAAGDLAPNITPGQVNTARLLTAMLRHRYAIPPGNCATHAQVSINPASMLVGYHTDWAGNFPFEEIGLPDNYSIPLPSQLLFGFGYDPVFLQATGSRMWKGLLAADDAVRDQAKRNHLSPAAWKGRLQAEFRRVYPRGVNANQHNKEGE